MKEHLSPDNPFFRAMGRLGDLILLNLIFLLTSLPLFTMGASVTALYSMTRDLSKNQESYLIRGYLKYFRSSFPKSTILWCIYVLCAVPLFYASVWLANFGNTRPLLFLPYIFLLMLYAFSLLYVFPLHATFENTIPLLIRNALLTAVGSLPYTILLMLLFYLPICFTILFPEFLALTLGFWLLIGCSLLSFGGGYLYRKVLSKYLPK